jgi:hypothetical protein
VTDATAALRVEPTPAPVPTAPVPTAPATGAAELQIVPESAAVAIDGNRVTLEHGVATLDLPPGSYALTVTAPGYLPRSSTLEISANDTTALHLTLKPKPRSRPVTDPNRSSNPDAIVNPFTKKRPK